jgi:hypothetical protein
VRAEERAPGATVDGFEGAQAGAQRLREARPSLPGGKVGDEAEGNVAPGRVEKEGVGGDPAAQRPDSPAARVRDGRAGGGEDLLVRGEGVPVGAAGRREEGDALRAGLLVSTVFDGEAGLEGEDDAVERAAPLGGRTARRVRSVAVRRTSGSRRLASILETFRPFQACSRRPLPSRAPSAPSGAPDRRTETDASGAPSRTTSERSAVRKDGRPETRARALENVRLPLSVRAHEEIHPRVEAEAGRGEVTKGLD